LSELEKQALAEQLRQDLMTLYGSPILTLKDLQKALNYRSVPAVKQAIIRETFPLKTFLMPNRRDRFALAKDVAEYLAEQAFRKENNEKKDK
jgi:hypothetical protein